MPSATLQLADVPKTYAELRRAVEPTLLSGQREIERDIRGLENEIVALPKEVTA